jgi:hypothetical protein
MKTLVTCMFALALLAGPADAQLVDIDDIQFYDPVTGLPASPYDGQQVSVVGTVYVVGGTYNSGTHYIQGATGGIQFFQSGTSLEIGDTIEVVATVGITPFGNEIQLVDATWDTSTPGTEPPPIDVTPGEIFGAPEPYELVGNFAAVTGDIAAIDDSAPLTWFEMVDSGGGTDTLYVYVDTDTGIDLSGMMVGDEYKVLGPLVIFDGLIELKPRQPADLIADPTLPIIREVDLANWVPMENDPITVQANAIDDVGIAQATIFYRDSDVDGEAPGPWSSAPLDPLGSGDYEGTIPGQTNDKVDFYVTVEDQEGQVVTSPPSAPDSYFECAIGLTSIYEMQYVDPDSTDQTNPYEGKVLNIRGVVTAGTGDTDAPSKIVVQEMETGPYGGYRYGAVLSYLGSGYAEDLYRGDLVEIGGSGFNFNGLDQINPHNANAINLVAFGMQLPPAERATTGVLADDSAPDVDGTPRLGEAYESVWVKTFVSTVLGVGEFENYWISDTGAWADSLEVQPNQTLTYIPTVGDVLQVEGYVDYTFGDYQLRPLGDEYLYFEATGIDDTPNLASAGGFTGVYPNPFNPATNIEFVLGRDELTQLNIYNLRGELVRSLVNERLPHGTYTLSWDGRNQEGMTVASGPYFARLRIGTEVMQVRKLSLVK